MQSTPFRGLGHFRRDKTKHKQWADWRKWPKLSIAADQGSDGMAVSWWGRAKGFNWEWWWDFSHGAWGDTKKPMKDAGLFSLFLLWLVTFNLPHGPWNDDMRYCELQGAWTTCVTHFNARTFVLFEESVASITKSLLRAGVDIDTSGDVDEQVWDLVKTNNPLNKKGHKCNLNRFFEGTGVMRDAMPAIKMKQFQYEFLGLETGVVATKKMVKFMAAPVEGDDAAEGKASTDQHIVSISDKAIRGCAHNALAIAIGTMSDPLNESLLRMMLAVILPVESWHRFQSHKLRNSQDSVDWVVAQLGGAFMKHVCDVVNTLSDIAILEDCSFYIPSVTAKVGAPEMEVDPGCNDDNTLADYFGDFVLSSVSNRQQRSLWLIRGWPARMSLVLGTKTQGEATLLAFQEDLDSFRAMDALPHKSSAEALLLRRSVFQSVPVQQYVEVTQRRAV